MIEDARYAPYIARQEAEIRAMKANEAIRLGEAIDYRGIAGLSNEMVERLEAARPANLGAAERIRGVTPAALGAGYIVFFLYSTLIGVFAIVLAFIVAARQEAIKAKGLGASG